LARLVPQALPAMAQNWHARTVLREVPGPDRGTGAGRVLRPRLPPAVLRGGVRRPGAQARLVPGALGAVVADWLGQRVHAEGGLRRIHLHARVAPAATRARIPLSLRRLRKASAGVVIHRRLAG